MFDFVSKIAPSAPKPVPGFPPGVFTQVAQAPPGMAGTGALIALALVLAIPAMAAPNGCVSCHGQTDAPTMHPSGIVYISCVDCHGGNAEIQRPAAEGKAYDEAKKKAHPQPKYPKLFPTSANPVRAYSDWLKESPEYIKFVNPGDLRVATETCGKCHIKEVRAVSTSMMTHGGMLWGAALYNNGGFPYKDAHFGESYGRDGKPRRILTY